MWRPAVFTGPVHDWHGALLNRDDTVRRLRIGDRVRLLLLSGDMTSVPYVRITAITYYNKTSDHTKPKLFTGVVTDTYGTEIPPPGTPLRFHPYNIGEVPAWSEPDGTQPRAEIIRDAIHEERPTLYVDDRKPKSKIRTRHGRYATWRHLDGDHYECVTESLD